MDAEAGPKSPLQREKKGIGGAIRFFAVVGCLATLAMVSCLAVVLLVPEENDYARATLLKHSRLAEAQGEKVVLIGGSNLAYGIDSKLIEQATGCTVINMGMNGFFGASYMLAEVEARLRPGDVAVIAFEWETYFTVAGGNDDSLLVVAKANPAAISYLTWKQRARVLGSALPDVARRKVLRLIRTGLDTVLARFGVERTTDGASALSASIETYAGFNAAGDLVSHLGVPWPYEKAGPGPELTADGVDENVLARIEEFARRMEERGIHVVVSYTPTMRGYYVPLAADLNDVHERLVSADLNVPSTPESFVYDEPLFFDTAYHLVEEGRSLRTQQLVADLERALPENSTC